MTMSRLTINASAGLIILALAGFAYTQDAHFGYVEEPVNPRAVGMGCTGTANGSGGFSFYNPAGAAMVDSSFVAFEYGQQWSDVSRGLVETAWIFRQWFIGAAFQTQSTTFQITDNTGSEILPGLGSEQASLLSLQIGWRSERFAVGAGINGLLHHIYDGDAYALSASGGAAWSIVPKKLTVGAALLQVGSYHRGFYRSTFEVDRDLMPTTGRLGGSWNDTIIGRIPVNFSLDAVYSSNYRSVMVPVGCEIRPIRPLAIRLGKRFNLPTDLFTFGIGIFWHNISFDAAFTPSTIEGDLEMKWLMGLRYALAAKKRAPHQAAARVIDSVKTAPTPPSTDTAGARASSVVDSVNLLQPAVPDADAADGVERGGDSLGIPVNPEPSGSAPDSSAAAGVPREGETGPETAPPAPPAVTDDNPAAVSLPADATTVQQPVRPSENEAQAPAATVPADTVKP
ncbi:MAG: hypothetical protein JW913_05315 [Chitinispirillaceae bacterium]|nr:hypothetical protein [Chitinispirillaceae bacterium]